MADLTNLAVAAIPIGGAIWFLVTYNRFIRLEKLIHESWSDVDVALKRRYDLIPNLLETVKGYARHEREVLEQVVAARDRAVASTGRVRDQATDENELVRSVNLLLARIEAYPELRASAHFLALQRELVDTGDRIAAVRRFYNANTREYNVLVDQFPSTWIARLMRWRPHDFFEVERSSRRAPPRRSPARHPCSRSISPTGPSLITELP